MLTAADLNNYSNALGTMLEIRQKVKSVDNVEIDVAALIVLHSVRKKTIISRQEVLRDSNIDSHYICKLLRNLKDRGYIEMVRVRGNGTDPHYTVTSVGLECLTRLVK